MNEKATRGFKAARPDLRAQAGGRGLAAAPAGVEWSRDRGAAIIPRVADSITWIQTPITSVLEGFLGRVTYHWKAL